MTPTGTGSTTRSSSFDQTVGNFAGAQSIYRERLALDHAQRLYGNITDLTVNSNLGGMDNRFVATVAASSNQFNVSQDTLFFNRLRSTSSIRTAASTARAATRRSTPISTPPRCRSRTGSS